MPDSITLKRNQTWSVIALVALVGFGVFLAIYWWPEPVPIILGVLTAVGGLVGYGSSARSWTLNSDGLYRGKRRLLAWTDVLEVSVWSNHKVGNSHSNDPIPAQTTIRIAIAERSHTFVIRTETDAQSVERILTEVIPVTTDGQGMLSRITWPWRDIPK